MIFLCSQHCLLPLFLHHITPYPVLTSPHLTSFLPAQTVLILVCLMLFHVCSLLESGSEGEDCGLCDSFRCLAQEEFIFYILN